MTTTEPVSFRPAFGRWLTGTVGAICGFAALSSLVTPGLEAVITVWPWLALIAGACWSLYWRPEIRVDDNSVVLVNVWHQIEIPWSLLIGIETKWALTLVTAERRYRSWAAPAPGRSIMRNGHQNTHRLKDAAIGGEIRPGDLPHTDSGAAAAMVRTHWISVRDTEVSDDFNPSTGSATRSIHWRMIVAATGLIALAAAGLTAY